MDLCDGACCLLCRVNVGVSNVSSSSNFCDEACCSTTEGLRKGVCGAGAMLPLKKSAQHRRRVRQIEKYEFQLSNQRVTNITLATALLVMCTRAGIWGPALYMRVSISRIGRLPRIVLTDPMLTRKKGKKKSIRGRWLAPFAFSRGKRPIERVWAQHKILDCPALCDGLSMCLPAR